MKTAFAAALSLLLLSPRCEALAPLVFAGGSGSPLSVTLTNTLTYVITTSINTGPNTGPLFCFKGVGDVTQPPFQVTGDMTFSINGESAWSFGMIISGAEGNDITKDDVYLARGGPFQLVAGDIITLNAGTLTTSGNLAKALPANGAYNTFVFDNSGKRISTFGTTESPQLLMTGGNLIYTFTEPAGESGVTFGAEWSTTLLANDWHGITDTGIGPQHIFSVPIAGQTRLFIRPNTTAP